MKPATLPAPAQGRTRNPDAAAVTPAVACVGVVIEAGAQLRVQSGRSTVTGRRAASCLIEPVPGDTVACLMVAPDELWITAVLQREPGTTADVLSSERPLRIESPELTLAGARLAVQAQQATLAVDEAQVAGRQFVVVGKTIKLVGAMLSSVFDRVTHASKHYLRSTEGTDRVQAAHVECEAQQLLRLSGEHALINGDKLVKARGGQIHFG